MKKNLIYVFAALAALTVASCAKVGLNEPQEPLAGNKVTFTVSLPDAATKTVLGEDGKTVTWAEGDSILVTDGAKSVAVMIPDAAAGSKSTAVEIDASTLDCTKPLFAVYPYAAYAGVSGGAVKVTIPQAQSGLLGSQHLRGKG